MGRSKLEEDQKRRRYMFLLTPAAAALIEAIPLGERSRVVSRILEAVLPEHLRARESKITGGKNG